jgi:hypothetical protein
MKFRLMQTDVIGRKRELEGQTARSAMPTSIDTGNLRCLSLNNGGASHTKRRRDLRRFESRECHQLEILKSGVILWID